MIENNEIQTGDQEFEFTSAFCKQAATYATKYANWLAKASYPTVMTPEEWQVAWKASWDYSMLNFKNYELFSDRTLSDRQVYKDY